MKRFEWQMDQALDVDEKPRVGVAFWDEAGGSGPCASLGQHGWQMGRLGDGNTLGLRSVMVFTAVLLINPLKSLHVLSNGPCASSSL